MPELSATPEDFELARSALLEITSAETIGEPLGHVDEGDGVVTVYLGVEMTGYPGWRWTVSIAHIDDSAPSVLETEMTPGDDALLAPEWVPWEDRMAEQSAESDADGDDPDEADDDTDEAVDEDEDEGESDDDTDDDADDDDSDDDDADDDDADDDDLDDEDDEDLVPIPVLHSGDVDGVDIDELVGEDGDLGLIDTEVGDTALPLGEDEPLPDDLGADGRLSDAELVERADTTEDEPEDAPIDEALVSDALVSEVESADVSAAASAGVDEPEQTEDHADDAGHDGTAEVEPGRDE